MCILTFILPQVWRFRKTSIRPLAITWRKSVWKSKVLIETVAIVLLLNGEIKDVKSFQGFEFLYSFDKVNHPDVKRAQARDWIDEKSKHCIVLVTNIVICVKWKDSVMRTWHWWHRFKAISKKEKNSRTAYIYRRTSLGWPNKNWIFEHKHPLETDQVDGKFQEAWKIFNKGRSDENTGKQL